ncbi:MAG: DUF2614 family zinc ribbon-containing protein, partial [Thermoplasmata archaeon]
MKTEQTPKRSILSFLIALIVGLIILRYAIFESSGIKSFLLLFLSISVILISILYFFFPNLGRKGVMYECRVCGKLSDETFHGMCENCYRTYYADGSRF